MHEKAWIKEGLRSRSMTKPARERREAHAMHMRGEEGRRREARGTDESRRPKVTQHGPALVQLLSSVAKRANSP